MSCHYSTFSDFLETFILCVLLIATAVLGIHYAPKIADAFRPNVTASPRKVTL